MLVNRTWRKKKFLELAIWEVFYRRKRGLMNVDKQHVLQQLCSVLVDFQQFEGSISLLKKTNRVLSSGKKTYLVIWNRKGTVIVSCVPNTRFDHIVILL